MENLYRTHMYGLTHGRSTSGLQFEGWKEGVGWGWGGNSLLGGTPGECEAGVQASETAAGFRPKPLFRGS